MFYVFLFILLFVLVCAGESSYAMPKKAAKLLDEQEKPKEKDPEKEKLADRAALKMQRAMYRVAQGQGYYIREEDGDL